MSDGPPDLSPKLIPIAGAMVLGAVSWVIASDVVISVIATVIGYRILDSIVNSFKPAQNAASSVPSSAQNSRESEYSYDDVDTVQRPDEDDNASATSAIRDLNPDLADRLDALAKKQSTFVDSAKAATTKVTSASQMRAQAAKEDREANARKNATQNGTRANENVNSTIAAPIRTARRKRTVQLKRKIALARRERTAARRAKSDAADNASRKSRAVAPETDPNAWWLDAFRQLDTQLADGEIDERSYERLYDQIVNKRDADMQVLGRA